MNRKPQRSGAVVDGVDWDRWSVILCKPDAVQRGLVDDVLRRLELPGVQLLGRTEVTVASWQIHLHYWDMLVDRDWFPDRDIPACLDTEYVGRPVVVALAYGRRGTRPLGRGSTSSTAGSPTSRNGTRVAPGHSFGRPAAEPSARIRLVGRMSVQWVSM